MVNETDGITRHSWAGKTYQEVVNIAQQEGSIQVVPIGSIEQHGHHLPVATDTILVNEMANLAADRVSGDIPVLLTPPVWTGYSPHHMPFGGTITLGYSQLHDYIDKIAATGLESGFDTVLLINGHGGNASLINGSVSTLGVKYDNSEIFGFTYFELAETFINDIRESDPGGMGHAGEFETSLMLYLRPDLVDMDKLHDEPLEAEFTHGLVDMFESGPLSSYRSFDEYSDTGVIGTPTLATAEKGEQIYEQLGDKLETVFREIHNQGKR